MTTGLCMIFNHPFRQQLPLLREIYRRRFDHILFLHPLDPLARAMDVQVVYGGGYSFDAMVASAAGRIMLEFAHCDFVLFAHNDVLLNPSIDQATFADSLGLLPGDIMAPFVTNMHDAFDVWSWSFRAAMNWQYPQLMFAGGAFSAKAFLPSREEAKSMARRLGLSDDTTVAPTTQHRLDISPPGAHLIHELLFAERTEQPPAPFDLGYPLFFGFSDCFAVSIDILEPWLNNLGVLSAMALFPEVAIPTAHVLTATRIVDPRAQGHQLQILWSPEDREQVNDLSWIGNEFNNRTMFIHPLKYNEMSPEYLAGLKSMVSAQDV